MLQKWASSRDAQVPAAKGLIIELRVLGDCPLECVDVGWALFANTGMAPSFPRGPGTRLVGNIRKRGGTPLAPPRRHCNHWGRPIPFPFTQ